MCIIFMAGFPSAGKSFVVQMLQEKYPEIHIIDPKKYRPDEYDSKNEEEKKESSEQEKKEPEDKKEAMPEEVKKLLDKALQREKEHEAEKRKDRGYIPMSPMERDW